MLTFLLAALKALGLFALAFLGVVLVFGLLVGWCACAAMMLFGEVLVEDDEDEPKGQAQPTTGGDEPAVVAAVAAALTPIRDDSGACRRVLASAFDRYVQEPEERKALASLARLRDAATRYDIPINAKPETKH